jgi:hypothetical protein
MSRAGSPSLPLRSATPHNRLPALDKLPFEILSTIIQLAEEGTGGVGVGGGGDVGR